MEVEARCQHRVNISCFTSYFHDHSKWSEVEIKISIEFGFNDTSTFVGHFVSSPREGQKRDRRDSKGDEERDRGGGKTNESEETEEIKTFPLPLPAARIAGLAQL